MRCVKNLTGEVMGVYRVGTDACALDELARDYKFTDFAAWEAAEGVAAGLYVVSDAEEALEARGRKLFGPTFEGFAWYDVAESAAMLAADDLSSIYAPATKACSPFYRTMAEATLHGLRD